MSPNGFSGDMFQQTPESGTPFNIQNNFGIKPEDRPATPIATLSRQRDRLLQEKKFERAFEAYSKLDAQNRAGVGS